MHLGQNVILWDTCTRLGTGPEVQVLHGYDEDWKHYLEFGTYLLPTMYRCNGGRY